MAFPPSTRTARARRSLLMIRSETLPSGRRTAQARSNASVPRTGSMVCSPRGASHSRITWRAALYAGTLRTMRCSSSETKRVRLPQVAQARGSRSGGCGSRP